MQIKIFAFLFYLRSQLAFWVPMFPFNFLKGIERPPSRFTPEVPVHPEAFSELDFDVCRAWHKSGSFEARNRKFLSVSVLRPLQPSLTSIAEVYKHKFPPCRHIVQELCESRGGRPGLSVLTSLLVSVDVKLY